MKRASNTNNIDRRDFIKTSSLFAVAVTLPVFNRCKDDDGDDDLTDDCQTTADILGPYYKAGAPLGENIIPAGDETPPLLIEGKVFSHCENLLPDAVVEIWNANADGVY